MTVPRGVAILGIVAVISLALNLFLAGGLLGRQFHKPPGPGQEFDARLDALWGDMPKADQDIAREIIGQRHDALMDKWHASRAAGQHAALSLRSTPFEPNETRADLTKWNERIVDYRGSLQDMMIEIAGKISPEGRTHLRFGPGP